MVRCGCASDQCSCTIVAGPNVEISGTGSRTNPYVVSAATEVIIEGGGPTPADRITGEMTMWGGLSAPTGWLLCNGQAVNRAVYADLYAILGTRFGAGDGSTTFNLPNMTDRFPMGASGTSPVGTQGGDNDLTLVTANLPPHTHSINHDHDQFTTASGGTHKHGQMTSSNDADGNSTTVVRRASGSGDTTTATDGAHTHDVNVPAYTGTSGSTGSGTPVDIKPQFAALNFIIKT
jgi:microcystin-dependent protein